MHQNIDPRPTRRPAPTPRTLARLEDVAHLIRCDVDPESAARRCGWTPLAAERAAYRHGNPDIARAFGRVRGAQRRAARKAVAR